MKQIFQKKKKIKKVKENKKQQKKTGKFPGSGSPP